MKFIVSFLSLLYYGTFDRIEAGNTLVDYYALEPSWHQSCPCSDIDVTFDYQKAIYTFTVQTFKNFILSQQNNQMIFSPLSAWLSLAAFAEGTNGRAKEELLLVLGLPQDRCLRQKYYQIALRREISGNDVNLARTRLLAFDDNVKVNHEWAQGVSNIFTEISLPLKHNPSASVDVMKQLLGAQISTINLKGNSVLLDSFQPRILWTDAFSDIILKDSPFYNDAGEQVGNVDMMTAKKRVRMSYHPREQMKVIELPVGYNGRYRMLIATSLGSILQTVNLMRNSILFDVKNQLRLTKCPIEVTVPRFAMTTEIDLRNILEEVGLQRLWNDPLATKNISDPAALPSGLFQRTTIVLDNAGINPYKIDDQDIGLSDHETFNYPIDGQDFIANKPFMFGLVDAETYSFLFSTVFFKPSNSY